jgi:hypothetical protein
LRAFVDAAIRSRVVKSPVHLTPPHVTGTVASRGAARRVAMAEASHRTHRETSSIRYEKGEWRCTRTWPLAGNGPAEARLPTSDLVPVQGEAPVGGDVDDLDAAGAVGQSQPRIATRK